MNDQYDSGAYQDDEPLDFRRQIDEVLKRDDEHQTENNVSDEDNTSPLRYRGSTNDPAFGFILALALSLGLAPLIDSGQADLRYTIAWGVLALFGVLSWLFGHSERIEQEHPENVLWGIIFGLIIGLPLLAFGGGLLSAAVDSMFGMLSTGTLLAYLLFVIPLAETLFFRASMQASRPFWMIGLMSTLWSIVLYMPLIDIGRFPAVALSISAVLILINMVFSYVHQRNGLAASWVCQIVLLLLVVFFPALSV